MAYRYVRDQFDTVNLLADGDLIAHHDPSSEISLVISEDGSIIKHGAAENVSAWLLKNNQKAAAAGFNPADVFGELIVITVVARDLTDEMLDEISRCLATTGRASGLMERLTELREKSISASDTSTSQPGP